MLSQWIMGSTGKNRQDNKDEIIDVYSPASTFMKWAQDTVGIWPQPELQSLLS